MGYLSKFLGISAAIMLLSVSVVGAEEKDPLKPRVPADQMAEAKKMKNKFEANADSIAKGKALYDGKGTCFNCHGKAGDGQGEAGKILNPGPRDFTNCKFHKKKRQSRQMANSSGSSRTAGMVSLIPAAITEDEAWHIINYERSFCKKD